MKIGAYLTGPFGQSQKLNKTRNELKRGRGSEKDVDRQLLKDTKQIISLQQEASLDFIIDPMFNSFHLFQAFAENVEGVRVGPQENWFNNNVFYWRPQIQGPLKVNEGFTEKYIQSDLIPKDRSMAILPSPYSLLMLSDVTGYSNKQESIENLAEIMRAEAEHLVAKGAKRIQYDEPAIVVKQSLGSITKEDLELLGIAMKVCGRIDNATTSLHTYFGDAGPILHYLTNLPINCIGIDAIETSLESITKYNFQGKELAFGLVDARNTSLEKPEELLDTLEKIAEKCQPDNLWLTPNTGTEYRGHTHGINKLKILEQVRRMSND